MFSDHSFCLLDFPLLPGPCWMSLALDFDPVSVPGFICLSLPAFPSFPDSLSSVLSWLFWFSPPHQLLAIRHRSAGHSRMDVLDRFLIDHLPAEAPFPASLSHTDPEKWFLGSDWWLLVFLFPRP
ncbi:hypothetical protein ILYODFUR_033558 [Ilyodon furcidens]|uniref:Uncharacterized protein n=1 Tax=Ilyodon furcidens TaxID=33524 RepID=A0ABV0VJ82_9TELE